MAAIRPGAVLPRSLPPSSGRSQALPCEILNVFKGGVILIRISFPPASKEEGKELQRGFKRRIPDLQIDIPP